MSRKTEILSRRDFEQIIADMEADIADQLRSELNQWDGGDACERVQVTVDSLGRLDEMSSPRPA